MQNDLDPKGLLPCPFCGGNAKEHWPNSSTRHFIECGKCGARTATHLASHGGSALDDWNHRHLSAVPNGEGVYLDGETAALIERLNASAAHCDMLNAPYAAAACREAASRLSQAGVRDGWPDAPEGWQRTKPTYVRQDGGMRVEFIYGRDEKPWRVAVSLGNGASATISYHATPQEALLDADQLALGDTL